jgi:hypothetical protein
VVCNPDSGNTKMYMDGSLVAQTTSVMLPSNNGEFRIGRQHQFTSNTWEDWFGNIDEISIWNTALDSNQIQQYMSCPPTGNEAGLVGYWNFEEGSGTTALDQTSNGNDGTINGATYSTDVPEQTCLGCTATDSIYLDVLNAQIAQNDTTICFGDSVQLSVGQENGQTLFFDGIDDYIDISPFSRASGQDVTISFTAKGMGTATCFKTPAYESYFNYANDINGNRIVFHIGTFNTNSGHEWYVTSLGDLSQDYHNYTVTVDDQSNGTTIAEVFLDGVSLGQHVFPYSIPSYSYLEIGRNVVELNGLFDGNISNIQVWNDILSQQEISDYMQCPPEGDELNLLSYWDYGLDGGSPSTDLTLNGYDGVVYGA